MMAMVMSRRCVKPTSPEKADASLAGALLIGLRIRRHEDAALDEIEQRLLR